MSRSGETERYKVHDQSSHHGNRRNKRHRMSGKIPDSYALSPVSRCMHVLPSSALHRNAAHFCIKSDQSVR